MTAQMVLGAVLVVPALLWSGLPAAAAWPWIVASTLMNAATISALLRAYEVGGFGLVYPVMRAVAVLLVVPMAAVLTGEKFGPATLAGIVAIALSLAVLALDAMRDRAVTLKALGWTLAAGLGTAA